MSKGNINNPFFKAIACSSKLYKCRIASKINHNSNALKSA